jgi:hypothetical protein
VIQTSWGRPQIWRLPSNLKRSWNLGFQEHQESTRGICTSSSLCKKSWERKAKSWAQAQTSHPRAPPTRLNLEEDFKCERDGEMSALSQVRWAINVWVSSRIEEERESSIYSHGSKTSRLTRILAENRLNRPLTPLVTWLPVWLADCRSEVRGTETSWAAPQDQFSWSRPESFGEKTPAQLPGASSAGYGQRGPQLKLKVQLSRSPAQLKSSAAAEEAHHSWS